MKFRLLSGKHWIGGERKEDGTCEPNGFYKPGDIIETNLNLELLNAPNPESRKKFERVSDTTPVSNPTRQITAQERMRQEVPPEFVTTENSSSPNDELDSMTIGQLKDYAAELEIELTATKRADIIKEIREATAPA